MTDRPPIAELLKKNPTFAQLVFSREQEAHFIFLVVEGSFILHLQQRAFKTFETYEIFGEIAVLNSKVRTGAVRAQSEAVALTICGTRLFSAEYVSATTALKVVRALAVKITNYLRSREDISIKELIDIYQRRQDAAAPHQTHQRSY